jgi:hypothetical protein
MAGMIYHSGIISLAFRSQNLVATQRNPPERHAFMHINSSHHPSCYLSILDDLGVETLGVLDVDGLDVGVQLLLGALLVVTLTRDADTETERNTLDTGLPDLLVELGVETDVLGAL